MAKSYCQLDKKGNFDGCPYPDMICSDCGFWIPQGKVIKENK